MTSSGRAPPSLSVSHTYPAETKALLSLAAPLIVAQLAQMAMGMVGTLAAGRLGVRVLAAQALGATVFMLVLITAYGAMAGLDPHVAQAMGAGQPERAGRLFRQGMWLAGIAALPMTAGLWLAPHMLLAMGQEPELVRDTAAYLDICALGLAPAMFFVMCRSFASAVGATSMVMVVSIIGNVIHAVLAFRWAFDGDGSATHGLRGLGWATVVCRVGMAVGLLAWVQLAPRFRHVRTAWQWPQWQYLAPILRSGLPLGLQYGLEVTGFVLITLWMGLKGAPVLAAHEIALSAAAVAFQLPFSLGSAAAMRIGHAVGRRDQAGIRRAGWTAFGVGAIYSIGSGIVILIWRQWIADQYLPDGDPAVLALAVHLLAIGAAFQLADGLQAIGFGVLRGLDDTRLPVVFNVLGFALLGLPLGYICVFVLHWHVQWLWWGLSLALGTVALSLVLRFWWWTANTGRIRGFGIAPLGNSTPETLAPENNL